MHSHQVFWLSSYHASAKNTAKNLVPVIQMGKTEPIGVNAVDSPLPRLVLEEEIFNSHGEYSGKQLFWESLQILRCQKT